MDLRLIQSFLVFGNSGGIVEASLKLGISQPALSDHLRRFEEGLPEQVFLQKGRRKTLTPYGEELFRALNLKLSGINELLEETGRSFLSEENVKIRIAGRREILRRIAGRPFQFRGQIEYLESEGASVHGLLKAGKADIILTAEPQDGLSFVAKPIFDFSYVLVVPKAWNITGVVTKSFFQELLQKPYLAYRKQFPPLAELFQKYGLRNEPRAVCLFDDWEVLIKLAEAGKGWMLAPTSFIMDEKKLNLMTLPKEIRQESRFYLVYYRDQAKVPWFKGVVNEILAEF